MFRRAPKFCPAPSACCPLSVGKGTERGQRAQVFKDRPLCRHLSDLATAPPRRACRPPGHGEKRAKRCLFGAPSDKIPTFRQSIRRFPLSSRNSPALLLPEYVKNILLRSGFCPVPFSSPPACSPSTPAHRSLSCAPPRPRRSQFARTPAARRSLSCAPPACSPCAALASCRDRGRGGQNAVFSAHPPTKFLLSGNPYGDSRCLPAIRRPRTPSAQPVSARAPRRGGSSCFFCVRQRNRVRLFAKRSILRANFRQSADILVTEKKKTAKRLEKKSVFVYNI